MPGLKEIKIRIKSIGGMRRTTRAMQLVSAAKMRKAQDATLKTRPYSALAWELIMNLAATETAKKVMADKDVRESEIQDAAWEDEKTAPDPLILLNSYPQARKIAVMILSTNRGLVGSLNANLFVAVSKLVAEQSEGMEVDVITYGKKAREFVLRTNDEVLADFEKYDRSIKIKDIYPVSEYISEIYKTGQYRKIIIVYNHFQSTLQQHPKAKQLLPLSREVLKPVNEEEPTVDHSGYNYIFEPGPNFVFERLLPRIIESQIYQTVLESEASEQSARMVMMKNATEAAGDLISHLTLTYNKLRQNKITTELAEITAGKIALE